MGLRLLLLFVVLLFQQDTWFVRFMGADVHVHDAQYEVALHFLMEEGFHIQSNAPDDPSLIPASLDLNVPDGWEVIAVKFPEPAPFYLDGTEDALMVYSDKFTIRVFLRSANPLLKEEDLKGVLNYQACDKRKCYFPRMVKFSIDL